MPQTFKPKKPTSTPKSSHTNKKTPHTSKQKSTLSKTAAHRVIKPAKSSALAKQQNATRKAAAGLTGVLEKRLAERAGHVELVLGRGGRSEGRMKRRGTGGGDGNVGGNGAKVGGNGGEGKGSGGGKKGPTGKSVG